MRVVKGDLISLAEEGEFDLIVHGCNCFCAMGKGLALSIKTRYPQAYAVDRATVKGDSNKLGTYSSVDVGCFVIVNAYTQYTYSGRARVADYDAIRKCMASIKRDFSGLRIGYPLIGAGLAKGDWAEISKIIDEELAGENHTLVIFEK